MKIKTVSMVLMLVCISLAALVTWSTTPVEADPELPSWLELEYETPSGVPPWLYVLVDYHVYNYIEPRLIQYAADVENSGFAVKIYNVTGKDVPDFWRGGEHNVGHQYIRTFLQEGLAEGLVGCFMVGEVPYAIWTRGGDFWPIDFYYMDLDAVWTSSTGKNWYDGYSGDYKAEIWVGRLYTRNVTRLNNYFGKNHAYRSGAVSIALPRRALCYDNLDVRSPPLQLLYNDVLNVEPGTPADYLNRLTQGYEMICLAAHGYVGSQFYYWITGNDYIARDARAYFYMLYSSYNAEYTHSNCIANKIVMDTPTYGLLAMGWVTTGGYWPTSWFLEPLSEGDCFGEAFKKECDVVIGDQMTIAIIGDPALNVKFTVHDVVVTSITPLLPYGATEVYPTYWEIGVNVTVKNKGSETKSVTVKVYDYLNRLRGTKTVTLDAGENATVTFSASSSFVPYTNYVRYIELWGVYKAFDIKAAASTSSETDTNVNHNVRVRWLGDANADGIVNAGDGAILGASWYKSFGEDGYNWRADFNADGIVNGGDGAILGAHWYTSPPME